MNSVLSDKAEAKVYAAETLPELQAKAQDITEAISKFQMEARKYNAIMDIHVLEQDGFPKVPNFPDLSFDLPSFLELRVPSGSFTPAAQHEPVGSIKVEDTDSE
ncbi:uncharacterized protein UBRO_20777 [Ustilago bromivora]|nr:uncharacterized protein UBRO_20777 [Ustilago bromivora]